MRPVTQTIHLLSAAGLLAAGTARAAPARSGKPSAPPGPAAAQPHKAPVKPAPAPAGRDALAVSVAEAPVDPAKNIALVGVTEVGDEVRAWLVDIATQQRETVGTGDSAYGFKVKQ